MLINVACFSLIEFILFLSEALIFVLPIFGYTKVLWQIISLKNHKNHKKCNNIVLCII